eukprot:6179599-Pleurochrysis_carterae.AAC.1
MFACADERVQGGRARHASWDDEHARCAVARRVPPSWSPRASRRRCPCLRRGSSHVGATTAERASARVSSSRSGDAKARTHQRGRARALAQTSTRMHRLADRRAQTDRRSRTRPPAPRARPSARTGPHAPSPDTLQQKPRIRRQDARIDTRMPLPRIRRKTAHQGKLQTRPVQQSDDALLNAPHLRASKTRAEWHHRVH